MADAEIVGGNERIKDLMISLLLTAVRKEVCRAPGASRAKRALS